MSVQDLCDRLVANDAALTELVISLKDVDDAEFKLILDAAKKNKAIKKVRLVGCNNGAQKLSLSVPAALSLACLVSEHPKIQEIDFLAVRGIEFGPIALAIQQNRNLTRLRFLYCRVTPNLIECIRWLLTENALESLTLINNINDGEPSSDISGALIGNSSLKELVIHDDFNALCSETLQAIPQMIRKNQDFETIDLVFSETTTGRFELERLIAQAAEGHASLNILSINYCGASSVGPSAEDFISHAGTAEAVGTLLHNAPALRELYLTGFCIRSAGVRHLAAG
jgi:hypothetical protein